MRAFLKAYMAIWHESVASAFSQAGGIALGLCGGMLVHARVCIVYRDFFYGCGTGWPHSASMDGLPAPAFAGWVTVSATARVP